MISQLLGNWLRGFDEWQQAIVDRAWPTLADGVREDLVRQAERYVIWWQGVKPRTPPYGTI